NGTPAVGQGAAFFGGCDGYLHMVNLETGELRKQIELATYIAGSTALSGNFAFTGDYDGLFTCTNIETGKVKWQWDNPESSLPILASPAITEKVVVIGGQDKHIRCFSKSSGALLWSFNAGGRVDASPVVVGGKIIVSTMDGMVYVLKLQTGEELWSYEIGSAIPHNPAVVNGRVILAAGDGAVYCFEN
ncbi:MAG: PQQ-like beta-propeller repeat protein, partial [Cyclobacteriaceae bacterium]|nr:PQQ-like beta-propeller repeat protein [Cyclobacteriaceae bacterium]